MKDWALILGSSSGFGAATALELSRKLKLNILGVHLDRKEGLKRVEELKRKIKENGVDVLFFNVNAGDEEKRKLVLDEFQSKYPDGRIRVFMHSIAFGTLKPFIADTYDASITKKQLEMTLDLMANTLVYWVQEIFFRGLFKTPGARIFAMTSEGSLRVTKHYGAVSGAKALLESHIRQLALELAPHGITANAIMAGVTDTPALRKIPGHEEMIEMTMKRNPHGRLTTPEDVARAIAVLSSEDTYWITGNVIRVDGGEVIAGLGS